MENSWRKSLIYRVIGSYSYKDCRLPSSHPEAGCGLRHGNWLRHEVARSVALDDAELRHVLGSIHSPSGNVLLIGEIIHTQNAVIGVWRDGFDGPEQHCGALFSVDQRLWGESRGRCSRRDAQLIGLKDLTVLRIC